MRAILHSYSLSPNKESVVHSQVHAFKLPKNYYFFLQKPYLLNSQDLGICLPQEQKIITLYDSSTHETLAKHMLAQSLINQAEAYETTARILKEKARKVKND